MASLLEKHVGLIREFIKLNGYAPDSHVIPDLAEWIALRNEVRLQQVSGDWPHPFVEAHTPGEEIRNFLLLGVPVTYARAVSWDGNHIVIEVPSGD